MGFFDKKDDTPKSAGEQDVEIVPIMAERLSITKNLVDAGGVRIHKRTRSESVTVDEPLLRQSVQVTRTPIGRNIDAVMPVRYEGEVTVIPIIEERLVTRRQLFLVEEVRMTRIEQIDHLPQVLTLRHEEAIIERQSTATGQWVIETVPGPTQSESAPSVRSDLP